MNKKDFEKIFQRGFNKKKIYFEDAKNGESELRCFICNHQAGFGYVYVRDNFTYRKKPRVKCVNRKSHAMTLIKYTSKFVEMVNDLQECGANKGCELKADT